MNRQNDIKKQLKKTYNAIAEDFDRTRQKPWKEVSDFLVNFLKKSSIKKPVLLDLGCGTGRHLKLAKEMGFENLIGIDFSKEQISFSEEKVPDARFVVSDATKLSKIKDNSIDIIIYIATLHHLPTEKERLQSLKECKRVLKPNASIHSHFQAKPENGKILISCWSSDNPKFAKLKDENNDVFLKWNKEQERFYHLFSRGELTKLLKKSGFQKIKEYKSGNNFWAEGECH